MPVTTAQAAMVPTGARVIITSPEGDTWAATAGGQSPDEGSGTVHITLDSLDEGPVCADQCTQVPVTGQSSLRSEIITVQEVSGLVVPSSALVTEAGGQTAVILEARDEVGSIHPLVHQASLDRMRRGEWRVVDEVEHGCVGDPAADRHSRRDVVVEPVE